MNAPPLPEIFGNYALRDFVEIVSPDNISWLPQTIGWLWLGAALLIIALHYCWRALRHWYQNRYRREAAQRLLALSQDVDQANILADINGLLKITALAAYSREHVARLSGENWVNFLNQQCEQPSFNPRLSSLLAKSAYQSVQPDTQEQRLLVRASLAWINQHRGRQNV